MKRLILSFFIMSIIFAGCELDDRSHNNQNNETRKGGSVSLNFEQALSRTTTPGVDMTIAYYDVYGKGPDGTNFKRQGVKSEHLIIEYLAVGEWTITVDAFNKDKVNIAAGASVVSVLVGDMVSATVIVRPLAGKGNLKIILNWPEGTLNQPVIESTLTYSNGDTAGIPYEINGNQAIYTGKDLAAGYYKLLISLKDGATYKWGTARAIRIITGFETVDEINAFISGDIGGIGLSIRPELQNPINISFNTSDIELAIGTNATITATMDPPDNGTYLYTWYFNGRLMTGETLPKIILGSTLPKGIYQLDLLVTKDNIISSGTVKLTILPLGVQPTVTPTPTHSPSPTPTITTPQPTGSDTPTPTNAIKPMVAAASYNTSSSILSYSLALRSDGTIIGWGNNDYGQLGNGSYNSNHIKTQVYDLTNAKAIEAASRMSVALKTDGTVWTWGYNENGLGDGKTTQRFYPVKISGLSNITAITSGFEQSGSWPSYCLALKSDGTVWSWGINTYGELGNGTNTPSSVPVQVKNLADTISISTFSNHCLALKRDGTVWSWGVNGSGQLGNGTKTSSNEPVCIDITNVVEVAAGTAFSIVCKKDNSVWAWGNNDYGEYGNATAALTYPTRILNLEGFRNFSAGYYYVLAQNSNNELWGWGYNYNGTIGNGLTKVTAQSPVAVLADVIYARAGYTHSLAVKSDGTVWAWGINNYGELGDGTVNLSAKPKQVPNINLLGK